MNVYHKNAADIRVGDILHFGEQEWVYDVDGDWNRDSDPRKLYFTVPELQDMIDHGILIADVSESGSESTEYAKVETPFVTTEGNLQDIERDQKIATLLTRIDAQQVILCQLESKIGAFVKSLERKLKDLEAVVSIPKSAPERPGFLDAFETTVPESWLYHLPRTENWLGKRVAIVKLSPDSEWNHMTGLVLDDGDDEKGYEGYVRRVR